MSKENNPEFGAFRRSYFTAYLCGSASDWLKGPYLYRFYETRGFQRQDITLLFIAGYASSAIFGVVAGMMSDAFGRRKMCLIFCLLYILHCLLHALNSFEALFLARAISGVATALLASSFEAWMVTEHRKRFDPEDLPETFALQTQANAFVAIIAGLVAQGAVEVAGVGAPFGVAVPLLGLCAREVASWPENVGIKSASLFMVAGRVASTMNSVILRVGALQCLFEGSMHVFVFLWTPCLQRGGNKVPHGLIFSLYMVCMWFGGRQSSAHSKLRLPLGVVFSVAAVCLSIPSATDNLWLNLAAFCSFEWCVGCYFPQIAMLRSKYLDEQSRNATITLFRVPFNFIVVVVLVWGRTLPPPRMLLCTSAVLFLGALTFYTLPSDTNDAKKEHVQKAD